MTIDYDLPDNSSYYTEVLAQLKENLASVLLQTIKNGSNIPTNAIVIDPTDKDFEKYNGSTWDKYPVRADAKSFEGVALDDTGLATNDIWYYDGSDWVLANVGELIAAIGDISIAGKVAAIVGTSYDSSDYSYTINNQETENSYGNTLNIIGGGGAGGAGSSSSVVLRVGNNAGTEYLSVRGDGLITLNQKVEIESDLEYGAYSSSGASDGYIMSWVSGPTNGFSYNDTSSHVAIAFRNPNNGVGSIVVNGSATSYNTTSDHRLKNISKETDSNVLTKLRRLKVYEGSRKGSEEPNLEYMILAHEIQAEFDGIVHGQKDEVKKRFFLSDSRSQKREEIELEPESTKQTPIFKKTKDKRGVSGVQIGLMPGEKIEEEETPEYQLYDPAKLVPYLLSVNIEQQKIIDDLVERVQMLEAA